MDNLAHSDSTDKIVATFGFNAPLYVAWELTLECNANCLQCYSNAGSKAPNELNTKEALSIIDKITDAGVLVLAFSGGEPLLRSDWEVLLNHAVQQGLTVNVGTNGSTITPTVAGKLKKLGIRSVTVSLDGGNYITHEKMRRLPGLFNKTTNAIKMLSDYGVRVVVGFTPTRLNYKEGRSVIELSIKLGAQAVNFSEYVPAGRGQKNLSLKPEKLEEVLYEWISMRKEFSNSISIIWHDCRVALLVHPEQQKQYVGCGAGRLVARIMVDGSVTPCVFLPHIIGNLRTETFESIWLRSTLIEDLRERKKFQGNCSTCEHLSICGGCRSVANAFHGTLLGGDPYCWIKREDGPLVTALKSNKDFGDLPEPAECLGI